MRGQKILSENGIQSRIKRSSKRKGSSGCGYVLSVSEKDSAKAADILHNEGIRTS